MSDDEVRFSATVTPEAAPAESWARWVCLAVFLAGCGHALRTHPATVGLPIALPIVTWWLVVRSARRDRADDAKPYTVRFLPDVLEVEGPGSVGQTPWAHVTRALEDGETLVLRTPHGDVRLRRDQLPDEATLRTLLPPELSIEHATIPPVHPQPTKTSDWLWITASMFALYWIASGFLAGAP